VNPNTPPDDRRRRVSASTLALLIGLGALVVLAALTVPPLLAPRVVPTPIDLVLPTQTPTTTPTTTPTSSLASPTPGASLAVPTRSPTPLSDAAPTRVVIADMKIDLPVVKPAANETYPWCDVAEYLTIFSVPGMPGVTYLYAHARKGMFLPFLDASQVENGKAMLGRRVLVYTDDDLLRTYEITEVHRHTQSWNVADAIVGDALVLQTSETALSTGDKLTLVARQVGSAETVADTEAHPSAKPRVCGS
jgi:hypothetical protein